MAAGAPGARAFRSRRRLLALPAAIIAAVLATAPVAATEIYRDVSYLYTQDLETWYGIATVTRWYGGSPPGPIKTTIRLDLTDLKSSRWYAARIIAGECWSEGRTLVGVRVKSGTTGRLLKTVTLTATQRRAVQNGLDRGWPLGVMFIGNGMTLCGPLE